MTKKVYYNQVDYLDHNYVIASTDVGLAFVGSPNAGLDELVNFYPTATLVADEQKNKTVMQQMKHYIDGNKDLASVRLDISGTPFQEAVWTALRNVPYGTLITYQDLANQIGRPQAAQAVGNAVGKNPALIAVPCHRVVAKNNRGSGYRGGLPMKEWLNAHEQKHLAMKK
ncbi:methylated-DNA--[protein]-cysteine S-methyltransferase [Weissella viridescens]|uniref:methylated-DNA--[protein]-cysteine S-methyltransferase n=1 Tax=Weissella viridescens TaxID=1629 RepID=A0A3P2RGJ3_WEIVI|nr:methylated-DNA--[protein]-cysteine S-methyltransferase [Weissella viridescens]RRG18441.1 methylated-DNA--[protein]-cysteine S-methyltransferase [Weissella viridescens]